MFFARPHLIAAAALLAAGAAQAQSLSSVTLYGSLDQYLNAMRSSSGATLKSVEDGAYLRSRFGVRGLEDLGGGLSAKFQMEGGFSADTGGQADGNRFWDRQAWVGLASKDYGELRFGRQNGPIQTRGGYIDHTARTLGSVINNFGVPSRYDNDVSYLSPRLAGVQVELHAALPESASGNRAMVYQWALDYVADAYRLGYLGLRGRPQAGATVDRNVVYDNLYANWVGEKATVYLAYVHSNNNTATAVSNNAGTILGNVGGVNAGTNADLHNFYNIVQLSADYKLTPQLRLGALVGRIADPSHRDRGANGAALTAYYDLSKRTMLLGQVETLRNDSAGGWRPAGSAGLKDTFTQPDDINGRTISGVQLGIVHRF